MPLVPNNGALHLAMQSPGDVARLVEIAASLDPLLARDFSTPEAKVFADIGDHLLYLSATHPDWFAPYRDAAITDLVGRLPMDLGTAAVLLPGVAPVAAGRLSEIVAASPRDPYVGLQLLAATADPGALDATAEIVRSNGLATYANTAGIHVGADGPASWRFTPHRYAVSVASGATDQPDVIVGRPLADVTSDPAITWHYASFVASRIEGLPTWKPIEVHLVAPRTYWYAVQGAVTSDGRYTDVIVDGEGEPFDDGLLEAESDPARRSLAALVRFNDELTYRNGHVHLTPGVVGTAGGPPIGIYPNPTCSECGELMFHVATVEHHINEYGEGFRSAFICEICHRAASTGTNWN